MQQLFQAEFRSSLGRVFSEKVRRNPRYSKRSFASALKVSSSALSEILSGKRNVSVKYAETLLVRANVDSEESRRILQLAKAAESLSQKTLQQHAALEMDQFHLISDWHYFAILSLAETEGFTGEEPEIVRRLSLDAATVAEAVERLVRLSLLLRDADGKLRPTNESYIAKSATPSAWIRRYHSQSLARATESLERTEVNERHFMSMTAALDPSLIPSLKRLIDDFLTQASAVVEHGAKRRVYRLGVQLFPLSDEGAAATPKVDQQDHQI